MKEKPRGKSKKREKKELKVSFGCLSKIYLVQLRSPAAFMGGNFKFGQMQFLLFQFEQLQF
jgi:hypothetical protein